MKKNVIIVILAVLMVAASGIAVYFKLESKKDSENLNSTINSLNDKVAMLELENQKDTDTTCDETASKTETTVSVLSELNSKKCINDKENSFVLYVADEFTTNISIQRDSDKKSAIFYFDTAKVKDLYDIDAESIYGKQYAQMKIDNFDTEIIDIKIESLGHQAVGYEVALFLMKDGTVEYMPLFDALKNNNIKSYGKIPEVTDITKIAYATAVKEISYGTPVAIKADGSFYNLYTILKPYVMDIQ